MTITYPHATHYQLPTSPMLFATDMNESPMYQGHDEPAPATLEMPTYPGGKTLTILTSQLFASVEPDKEMQWSIVLTCHPSLHSTAATLLGVATGPLGAARATWHG
jgi:hypothetical protein